MNLEGLKNGLLIIIVPLAFIASAFYRHQSARVSELDYQLQQARDQLAHAHIPLQRDTIHDSIFVVTQTVVEVVPRKMKEALAADEQLINDLKLKVRQLEAMQTTTLETSDSVPAQYQADDSCFHYSDQWADLSLHLKDTTFYYNIRDSLATYIYHDYRHHFLWWRWGIKGYWLKIVNFNPHARVIYNRYIKAER